MTKVVFLKNYKDWSVNQVVDFSTNEAFGLIDSGIARRADNRDFLVKPEFHVSKVKAFRKPPRRK